MMEDGSSHGAAQSEIDVDSRDGGSAYSEVSQDFARFPVFTVETLVENLFVCGVLSLSHHGTPQTIGAKWLNLGFFILMFVVYHILKIL